MYKRLKKLYQEGRLSVAELENAQKKGWITDEQFQEIKGTEEK